MTAARLAPAIVLAALTAAQPPNALAAKPDCRPKDLARLASWGGVWITKDMETGINGRDIPGRPPLPQQELAGFSAPWKPEGWTLFESAMRLGIQGRTKQSGWAFPVMMDSPAPFKFVIAPGETVIASQYREIRYVYTDGRRHPSAENLWPTVWGDSTGCWRGQTLVIDTVAVKYSPDFNFYAPPLSDQAHFVERIRLAAPGRLESDITITDPVMLEKPWTLKVTYIRPQGIDRIIHDGDIYDNDRSTTAEGSGTIAPPRDKVTLPGPYAEPDVALTAADLDRVVGDYAYDGAPLRLKAERRGDKLFLQILPAVPWWLPMHARGALDFTFADLPFHFTTDAAGQVNGFTTANPDGTTASGKRVLARR
jgi:hypothetical protein